MKIDPKEFDRQRCDDALVSSISLLRTLGRDDKVVHVAIQELEFVRTTLEAQAGELAAARSDAVAAGDHDEGLRSRIEAEWVDYERSHIAGDNPRGLPFVYFMRGYERGLSAPRLRSGAEAKLAGREVTDAMVEAALVAWINAPSPLDAAMRSAIKAAMEAR